jgi:hypothetical protein
VAPKREYNAVSAIADEIWQYRTGGDLTIFDKDRDTAEIKHTASLLLLCTVGGRQATLDARTKFKISQRSLKKVRVRLGIASGYARVPKVRDLSFTYRSHITPPLGGGPYFSDAFLRSTEVQALMFVTPPALAETVLYGQNDLVSGRTRVV